MNGNPMSPEQFAQFQAWQASQQPFQQAAQQFQAPPQYLNPGLMSQPSAGSRIAELRAQILGAQVTGQGQYLPPGGKFRLQGKLLTFKRTQQAGFFKESFIAEFTVITSSLETVKPGETRSRVENTKNLGWDGRLKAMLIAMAGFDPYGQITQDHTGACMTLIDWMMDDSLRVAAGAPPNWYARYVDAETFPGTSRQNKVVTEHKWSPVRGEGA